MKRVKMELLNVLNKNGISNYDDIKTFLENNPYKLSVKENGNLYMVSYNRRESDLNDPLVKQCRGIILEKESNKIVCYTFNKSELPTGDDIHIEQSIDGTQIRLYYYNNEWRYATTRCIDAKMSYWFSDKSFYELFKDADTIDYSLLNPRYCYSFVLCHPENRIVVKYEEPKIYHVLTRDLDTLEEVEVDIGIEKPRAIEGFRTYNELLEYTQKLNSHSEGYIIRDNCNRFKLKNIGYEMVKGLRGNTNNLLYRYIELRRDGLLEKYLEFYPELEEQFSQYNSYICRLLEKLYQYYTFVHVHKVYIQLPQHLKPFIYKIHGDYISTRVAVTPNTVEEELKRLHPSQLYSLLNKTFTIN